MVVLVITGVAFVLVEALLIYLLIRYRRRGGMKAASFSGNRRLETTWTLFTGVMLFGLAIYQYNAWVLTKLFLPDSAESLTVGVSANQFEWQATYPGPDGMLDTEDDLQAPINVLHFPVGQPVIIRLTSEDVIHSFFIPALRVKQDALPGRHIEFWFEATQPGEYELACAELCGLGHYRMRGQVTIEQQEAFDAWLADVAARRQ
jgi:cytochrome c oxidase subunit 2